MAARLSVNIPVHLCGGAFDWLGGHQNGWLFWGSFRWALSARSVGFHQSKRDIALFQPASHERAGLSQGHWALLSVVRLMQAREASSSN